MRSSEQDEGTRSLGELKGRSVWITGAGRGLGRALAEEFLRAGANVAVTARTVSALEEFSRETNGPGSLFPVPGDVCDPETVRAMADAVVDQFGTVDVLVNMAGINPTVMRSERLPDDVWRRIIDVNLSGTFYCCREAGKHMIAAGSGSIINVSSVHGSVGVPRMAAYVASKGGVETLTKALAVEWAEYGVRVNCLAPGYFETSLTQSYLAGPAGERVRGQIPLGRVGQPAELIGITLYLASSAASYVTGAIFAVDGGWTAR